ncbi:MAG: DUF4122 domain-containing protein [Tannerellaceae bacterium]|nr:DUF4122 domain-containing protein [Tannerellaceae bacterium]
METYLHFAVRLTVCGYVLYWVWGIVFNGRLFGLWDRIPGKPSKDAPAPVITVVTETELPDVVGKTTAVYLEDPELAAKVPAYTEKLEPSDFIGEEPDIPDDDVESDLSPRLKTPEEIVAERERFEETDDLAPALDPDFSSGLTYEEMSNAVGVLTVATDNEKQIIEAARTIHRLKDTDLFEFITHQVSNLENVERLMNDCLDDDGTPLAIRKSKRKADRLSSFNLNNFV